MPVMRHSASLALALGLAVTSPRPAPAEPIADWMVMDVCTDANDVIQEGVAPVDPACRIRRKIRLDETPPYRLRGWPPEGGCSNGLLVKWNMPVAKAGTTRIVSVSERTQDGCGVAEEAEAGADVFDGASIQWFDAGYGFIMGSWSPVGQSSFLSPYCAPNPASSRRFFRGWVIAPAVVPQPRVPGWGVFPSKLLAGHGAAPIGPCPDRYQHGLTVWIVDDVSFRGMKLPAIVSHHFAQADRGGMAPGPAEQMERTYWTREFGLTRWEKWARDDWSNPRNRQPADVLAKSMFAHGRCSQPYGLPPVVTPGLRTEAIRAGGSYSQVFTDPRTNERHTWYMTLCDDWTNLLRSPPTQSPDRSAGADERYWHE